MTSTLAHPTTSSSVPIAKTPILVLARLEARQYCRRVSIWLGWPQTLVPAALAHHDWPAGSSEQVIPVSFAGLALGTYVAAVRTGGRDVGADGGPLAEESPLGGDARALARTLALIVPVGLAALTVLAFAVVSRVEGGFWMGQGSRSTTGAVHSVVELVQPVLLVALAGVAGVAAGRRIASVVLAVALGVFVWTALFPIAWMWNGDTWYPIAVVQTMPLRIPLPHLTTLADAPEGWWIDLPNRYQRVHLRQLVHLPTVLLHLVYLLGLVALATAALLDSRRTARIGAGVALVTIGLAGQWMVSPL